MLVRLDDGHVLVGTNEAVMIPRRTGHRLENGDTGRP